MYEILILFALFSVLGAIRLILTERKRRKQALENWRKFEEEYPKRKDKEESFF